MLNESAQLSLPNWPILEPYNSDTFSVKINDAGADPTFIKTSIIIRTIIVVFIHRDGLIYVSGVLMVTNINGAPDYSG